MNIAQIVYLSSFAATGIVCLAAVVRAWDIDDDGVRRGLVALLVTTGTWSLCKVAFFVLPGRLASEAAYMIGLAIGFSTVWAWLYFCSAYTGRSYHRNTTIRRVSAGVLLGVVTVKLTNPIHRQYFTVDPSTTPFAHLAIQHGAFHWAATALSYALATIGMFMLFEQYYQSEYNTRPLAGLTVLIGVPGLLDVAAFGSSAIIDVIYAPLGVAAFVLGVLFVYERRFIAAQQGGTSDDAVVFVDDDGIIRDYSTPAVDLFPALEGAVGRRFAETLPSVADTVAGEEQVLELTDDGERRYYLVSNSTVALGESTARVVVLSDITTTERRKRELRRHNSQLEGFAGALTHELRNMLQIVDGRLQIVRERVEPDSLTGESVEAATEANHRMSDLVDDFTSLTLYGQTVEHMQELSFGDEVDAAWERTPTPEMELVVDSEGTVTTESQRLRELLSNAFVFARLNDATTVTVSLHDGGFQITGDGSPPTGDIEKYFEFGESVPTAESGMKLPNVRTFARALGWSVSIDTDYEDGVRLVVSDVATTVAAPAPRAAEASDD